MFYGTMSPAHSLLARPQERRRCRRAPWSSGTAASSGAPLPTINHRSAETLTQRLSECFHKVNSFVFVSQCRLVTTEWRFSNAPFCSHSIDEFDKMSDSKKDPLYPPWPRNANCGQCAPATCHGCCCLQEPGDLRTNHNLEVMYRFGHKKTRKPKLRQP